MRYYSQHNQDKYLDSHIFRGRRSGIFVEIGAHNGEAFSNTCFFERERGWTGICFEPIKKCYDELLTKRNCIAINACVSDREGEEEFLVTDGWTEMLSGMTRTHDEKHVERIEAELRDHGGTKSVITVPSVTLEKTLAAHNINRVDYCSIDTEGSEFTILRSIDFKKTFIYAITVENNYKDDRIRQYMITSGYHYMGNFKCDELYIKK